MNLCRVTLLSLSLTLTELFQNHVEWILPACINCLHLKHNWWFSWHMLSKTKSLPERFSWVRKYIWFITEVLPFAKDATFLLPTSKFSCYSVLFFKRWHAWRSLGFTSWPVRDNVLQTLFSRTSSPIDAGTGFISSDWQRWYWALRTAFLSNCSSFSQ